MDEIIFLESDEEITSVVDKLKGLEADSIRLVVPKGSTIAQSLVSLKLLKKQAKEQNKEIAIVTSDEVGKNLAARVGLTVYADVKSTTPLSVPERDSSLGDEPIEIDMNDKESVNTKTSEKSVNPADEKPEVEKTAIEKVPEENLPKDFQIHRYDEEPNQEEAAIESPPVEIADEPEEKSEPLQGGEIEAKHFVVRPVGKPQSHIDRAELEAARPTRLEDHISKTKKSPKRGKLILKISIISILVLAIIVVADLLFVKVNVNIAVNADVIEKEAVIKVEKDRQSVDLENSIIPGVQVSQEKPLEETFDATGEKDAGEKAKGTLAFKNESGVDEQISSGTTVRSSSGVEFLLDKDITVPKAQLNSAGDKVLGQINGSVTASESGTSGNLSSSTTYVVSGKSKITVQGATTGGVTKKIKVVTRADIDKAKNSLQSQKIDINSTKNKSDDSIVLDGAGLTELQDFKTSKNSGDEADKFTATAKLKYTAISFKNDQFREAVVKAVEKTLPQEKGLFLTDTDTITPTLKDSEINIGKISVNGVLKSHVGPKLDIAKSVESWKLRPISRIWKDLSKIPGIEVGSVERSPRFTLPISPIMTKNIKVKMEYQTK